MTDAKNPRLPPSEPSWVKTASPHSLISKNELMAWLRIETAVHLRHLIDHQGFPPPRVAGILRFTTRLTTSCRWRVGDVRAWIAGPDVLAQELGIKLGDPTAKNDQRNYHVRSRYADVNLHKSTEMRALKQQPDDQRDIMSNAVEVKGDE